MRLRQRLTTGRRGRDMLTCEFEGGYLSPSRPLHVVFLFLDRVQKFSKEQDDLGYSSERLQKIASIALVNIAGAISRLLAKSRANAYEPSILKA